MIDDFSSVAPHPPKKRFDFHRQCFDKVKYVLHQPLNNKRSAVLTVYLARKSPPSLDQGHSLLKSVRRADTDFVFVYQIIGPLSHIVTSLLI